MADAFKQASHDKFASRISHLCTGLALLGLLDFCVCLSRSFDAITKKPPGSTDFATLLDKMSQNCDYSLGRSA